MTNDSTWADLGPLNAQAAVINLGAKYCAYLDRGDFEGVASVFAEDAVMTIGTRSIVGRAALEEFFRKSPPGIHLAGLPFVTVTSATEAQSLQNFVFAADGNATVGRGSYIDRVRLDPEGCVFVERIVDMHPTGAAA